MHVVEYVFVMTDLPVSIIAPIVRCDLAFYVLSIPGLIRFAYLVVWICFEHRFLVQPLLERYP